MPAETLREPNSAQPRPTPPSPTPGIPISTWCPSIGSLRFHSDPSHLLFKGNRLSTQNHKTPRLSGHFHFSSFVSPSHPYLLHSYDMADPVTILGAASAVVSVINLLTKTIRGISELRSKWNIADLTVSTFEMQLTGLNFALTEIRGWADRNSEDPYYQLPMDLDHCLSHCRLLIGIIDAEIAALRTNEDDQLDIAGRIRILFKTQGLSEAQNMIEHVTRTLGLILGACNR